MKNDFVQPDPIAQQVSDQLLTLIKHKIRDAGGKISFADYMHDCLYSPGLGYYSAGSQKLGSEGDFSTAPEISSLFSRTLAQHILDVFPLLEQSNILEFGAGSGKMAIDILTELASNAALPDYYYIIEASADLRERQCNTIAKQIPELADKVVWLDRLPDEFIGVIVANEVCDAMPVHCLHFKPNHILERYITLNDHDELTWCEDRLSTPLLAEEAEKIHTLIDNAEMLTEINISAKSWLASVATILKQGICFVIDYGYPRLEYYHPQHANGTLMCYYQHQGHDNPLVLPGLQDITAHVDFTLLAQTAMDHGLVIEGFQTQAGFLLAGGITELIDQHSEPLRMLQQTTEVKRLTHPSFMGETFKVLTLGRHIASILNRCQPGDRRYCL